MALSFLFLIIYSTYKIFCFFFVFIFQCFTDSFKMVRWRFPNSNSPTSIIKIPKLNNINSSFSWFHK